MGEFRNRTETTITPGGVITDYDANGNVISVSNQNSLTTRIDNCQDGVGFPAGNGLIITHRRTKWAPLNGAVYYTVNAPQRVRTKIVNLYMSADTLPVGHLSVSFPAFSGASLAARMNPNRPKMDLPVFLAELKDLPGMVKEIQSFAQTMPKVVELIRDTGFHLLAQLALHRAKRSPRYAAKTTAEALGSGLLSYEFGWEPLLSDLWKLTGFQDAYNRKLKDLSHLYDNPAGMRRRLRLGEGSASLIQNNQTLNSGTFTVKGNVITETTSTMWCTQRFLPLGKPPSLDQRKRMAVKSLLGLNLSPSQLWAIMPWSWLIDWFSDVGNFLDANRGGIPISAGDVWVMRHDRSVVTRANLQFIPGYPTGIFSGGYGSALSETKTRTRAAVTPFPTSIPFLGPTQVSLLSSLSVSRRKSWHVNGQ